MQITINFKKIHLLVGTFLALTMAIIGLYTLDSNLLAIFVVIEIYLILLALFFFGISWINPQQPKQGENQLKSNSLYLANLFNQYSIFTESSIDGRIIYANENFIKCTGYSKNEILEMKYSFLQSGVHSSKFYADLWETVLAGNIWQGEICNKNINYLAAAETSSSSSIYYRVFITPIPDVNAAFTALSSLQLN